MNNSTVDPSDIKIIEDYEAEDDESEPDEGYKGLSSYKGTSEAKENQNSQ